MCEQLFYVFSTDIVEGQLQKGTEENETWKKSNEVFTCILAVWLVVTGFDNTRLLHATILKLN